ncbi:MAG: discoidin domain-containing protein [Kofleriaceae bacterium]
MRTADSTAPRLVWSFEENSHQDWAGITFTIGRLRRHALLTSDLANLNGRYGFTVNWSSSGTIANATDSMGRQLLFDYSTDGFRVLVGVSYKAATSAAAVALVQLAYQDKNRLERIRRIDGPSYTRFLYYSSAPADCDNCSELITAVLQPGPGQLSPPGPMAPKQATEVAVEENWYGKPPLPMYQKRYIGFQSRYPGRHYGYQYEPLLGQTTQFDLLQPQPASCASASCSAGFACRNSDKQCYRAESKFHDVDTLLPLLQANWSRSYTSTGAPRTSVDSGGSRTTYGFDTAARVRCIVRGDDDSEAFATPSNPNTSDCAGPGVTAQVVRVDYAATSTTKTTPSLLGGNVVEVTTLDPATLLVTSTSTTGNTKDINGAVQSQTRVTSRTYDGYGRVLDTNGPLVDSTALDKTTTTYHTTFNSSFPFNLGQVSQVTRYVGTSASSYPLTETYSEYDSFGVPRRVVGPNGQATTLTPSADRLTWTVRECATGAGCTALSTAVIQLNPDGTIRSTTDPDGVCTTYKYASGLATPIGIRRAPSGSGCGADFTSASSGEVEIRTYANGSGELLSSVRRYLDGVQQYVLSGFEYDRDRRITKAPIVDGSASKFEMLYTDVLQTGVVAPTGPSAGAWRTETTVDGFGRPSAIHRFIDSSNKITHGLSYASSWSPRPTTLTRGQNGAAVSTTTFSYDDFGRLVDSTVPEAGPPGAPAPTRFEYDVGDRLIKKRVGSGTALVRTDMRTYDSLGRVLSVDNDTEHPVNCASLPSGTPIQDEEYKYDSCSAPDMPAGFSCGNALGRTTIARSVLQCGSSSSIVKRGRWFDYDQQGQVARVAYATVTGTVVGAPAISANSYSAAGRQLSYGSPLNVAYGTAYNYSVGKISTVDRTASSGLAYNTAYYPFGSLKSFETASVSNTSGTLRRLTWTGSVATNYSPSGFAWTYKATAGGSDVALMSQTFARNSAGLLQSRVDAAASIHSRDYLYDALTRLTREQWVEGASAWLKGQFTFGNGTSSSSPADARKTANLRVGDVNALLSDGDGYVSQGTETTNYAAGSTQPTSITRVTSALALTHDALGRRTADYDASEPTTSRRNYTYLPNGQLGSVESVGSNRIYHMRYDEDGHPVTISEYSGTGLYNTYELFWSGDLLIATQINFATSRPVPNATPCLSAGGCYTYSLIRWHYHYLGGTPLAATRERVHTDGTVYTNLFWLLTDERGLVHRAVDIQGATWWQAQWDANGTRTWIGRPQPEMWIPFGLPGQVVLGDYEAELYYTYGVRVPGSEATIRPSMSATASSVEPSLPYYSWNATDKNLATRWSSAYTDPQWLTIDLGSVKPISGVRLTWETAYADGYRIEVANSSSGPWLTVFSTTTGNGGVDEISFIATARYVRMYGTHRATPWGYSLWEFEVFGPWTRPPIALTSWRSYDPLFAGFQQPDSEDVSGRYLPEGLLAFRGNSMWFSDVDGKSSRELELVLGGQISQYSFDDICTPIQREDTLAALGKAWLNLSKCFEGLCGVQSFKRTFMYQLARGSIRCDDDPMALTRGPIGDFIGYPGAPWKRSFGRSELIRVESYSGASIFEAAKSFVREDVPRRYISYQDITLKYWKDNGYPTCLANLLAHETAHPTLDLIPSKDWGLSFPELYTKRAKNSQSDSYSDWTYEEDLIKDTMKDCDVCK